MNWIIKIFEKPLIKFTLIYLVFLSFFLFFGDRWGFHGDDISMLEGVINFQYKGPQEVYQYYWHPLTYHLNIFINNLIGNPKFLFFVPQIFGAANITLLLWSTYLFSSKKLNLLLISSFLLLLPELFYNGLYYNSSVFAVLPVVVTISLIFSDYNNSSNKDSFQSNFKYCIIGICSTISMFFRFEFVLCIPILWYFLLIQKTSFKELRLVLISSISTITLGLVIGIFNPVQILIAVQGYNYAIRDQGLSFHHSLKVIFSSINWIVWITLLIYLVYFLISKIKHKNWKSLLVFIPIFILLYPILSRLIFTPKYLVPIIIFIPFLLAKIALEIQDGLGITRFRKLSYIVIAVAFLLQLVSIQPVKHFPFIGIQSPPSFLLTANGPRSFGAYLYEYDKPRKSLDVNETGFAEVEFPRKLADLISKCDRDVDIIYLDKKDNQAIVDWWWAWPSFYLQLKGYKVKSYIPQKEIILGLQNQVVKMKVLEEQSFFKYEDKNLLAKVYIKSDDSFKDKGAYIVSNAENFCLNPHFSGTEKL